MNLDIKSILADPLQRDWTIQGFGMLRTYLDTDQVHRLHIWDPRLANDEVSTIHDHAWDFTSTIVSGWLANQRYAPSAFRKASPELAEYQHALIRAGEGGGILEKQEPKWLTALPLEHYSAGGSYHQFSTEIHESHPSPGTVTVISRDFHENRDLANVYWRDGDWVTAEPRPATDVEVAHFAALALERWTA